MSPRALSPHCSWEATGINHKRAGKEPVRTQSHVNEEYKIVPIAGRDPLPILGLIDQTPVHLLLSDYGSRILTSGLRDFRSRQKRWDRD